MIQYFIACMYNLGSHTGCALEELRALKIQQRMPAFLLPRLSTYLLFLLLFVLYEGCLWGRREWSTQNAANVCTSTAMPIHYPRTSSSSSSSSMKAACASGESEGTQNAANVCTSTATPIRVPPHPLPPLSRLLVPREKVRAPTAPQKPLREGACQDAPGCQGSKQTRPRRLGHGPGGSVRAHFIEHGPGESKYEHISLSTDQENQSTCTFH
jgi:hypothetical protein